jgi:pyridoxamine 5'-phosphate oxidase
VTGSQSEVPADPIRRFGEVMGRAVERGLPEPTAMAVATSDAEGRPAVRMLLLKGYDERGFVFYSNLESRKAVELEYNPHAALCFFWAPLETQIRIEGEVETVPEDEADAYFASRPRESQIGAWSSRQSQPLDSREELEGRILEAVIRFGEEPIPRPPFWSGYRLRPSRIEFWTGKPGRLHDREVYLRDGDGWRVQLLYP